MNELNRLVVFTLDGQRYALHLENVTRIVRAVEITPLPKAPDIVSGVVNMQGQVIPVINVRRRFCLPQREVQLEDHIIIAATSKRPVALVVDAAEGVIDYSGDEVIPRKRFCPARNTSKA